MLTKRQVGVAELMCGKVGHGGDHGSSVVVIVIVDLGKLLHAEVAHAHHAVMAEARALDDVGRASGAKYLT